MTLLISQAETAQAGLRPEQQARQDITVMPYISFDRRRPNFLYISTGTNRVSVGDGTSFSLNIVTAVAEHRQLVKHVTYLVGLRHAHALSLGGSTGRKANHKYHTGAEQGEDHSGRADGRERSADQQSGPDDNNRDDAVLPFCGLLQNPLEATGGGGGRLHLGGCSQHLPWGGE